MGTNSEILTYSSGELAYFLPEHSFSVVFFFSFFFSKKKNSIANLFKKTKDELQLKRDPVLLNLVAGPCGVSFHQLKRNLENNMIQCFMKSTQS